MVLAREMSVEESGAGDGSSEYAHVHSQLVAYVLALSGRGRGAGAGGGGVWREHSYARASKHASRRAPRSLLAPPDDAPDPDAPIDVGREGDAPAPALPPLPFDSVPDEEEEAWGDEEVEQEWETRVAALAPSAAHARLAERAADILRALRLARLAASAPASRALRREQARAAAAKLRRALAPTWTWSAAGAGAGAGSGGGGGAAWLYSVLSAYLPRRLRALLEELLEELRRAAPRLAARLPAAHARAAADPLRAPAPPRPLSTTGPLLVWVSAGRGGADARWERRLRPLLPTRVVGAAPPPRRARPDLWCAAQAAGARAELEETLAEAGARPVFLAGFEAGAALCCALLAALDAGAARAVRGLALLAPPLDSAEGEESLEPRAPVLLIVGGASGCRVQALEACAGTGGAGAGGARRLVLVEGADRALRAPARTRPAAPQPALDAAVAEEVAGWVRALAEADDDDDSNEYAGSVVDVEEEDEYAHLPSPWAPAAPPAPPAPPAVPPAPVAPPPASPAPAPAPPPSSPASAGSTMGTPPGTRAIEIVEGRVVSRVSGSTPLLLTPRRAPAPPAPPATLAHAPVDIMQMPIVFADDEPAPIQSPSTAEPTESPVTVTSGGGRGGRALKYTRVIVAKRGAGAAPPPRLPAPPPARAPAQPAPRPRHVLLRRAVQVVNRVRRPHKDH